jgi:hypothetical protein
MATILAFEDPPSDNLRLLRTILVRRGDEGVQLPGSGQRRFACCVTNPIDLRGVAVTTWRAAQ